MCRRGWWESLVGMTLCRWVSHGQYYMLCLSRQWGLYDQVIITIVLLLLALLLIVELFWYSAPRQESKTLKSLLSSYTYINSTNHRYLHIHGLRWVSCSFSIYLAYLKKKPLWRHRNLQCHRCALRWQQIISQLELLLFEPSISYKLD